MISLGQSSAREHNAREKRRGLSSGVPPAYNDHLMIPAQERFHCGCGVIDPLVLEAKVVVEIESPIPCAARDDDGASLHFEAAFEYKRVKSTIGAHRNCKANTKLKCLNMGAMPKALARDSGRKTQIVFYFGAGTGLSARAMPSIMSVESPSEAA